MEPPWSYQTPIYITNIKLFREHVLRILEVSRSESRVGSRIVSSHSCSGYKGKGVQYIMAWIPRQTHGAESSLQRDGSSHPDWLSPYEVRSDIIVVFVGRFGLALVLPW
jgi:hypothetical protein